MLPDPVIAAAKSRMESGRWNHKELHMSMSRLERPGHEALSVTCNGTFKKYR